MQHPTLGELTFGEGIWSGEISRAGGAVGFAVSGNMSGPDARQLQRLIRRLETFDDPINSGVLEAWTEMGDGVVIFQFENGYSLVLPSSSDSRREDEWYSHWYAPGYLGCEMCELKR